MAEDLVAFLLHPFKNVLLPKKELKEKVDEFARQCIELAEKLQGASVGLILPGSILEVIDPVLLVRLRELHTKGTLEWLCPGYTEPFISMSPRWLTRENITYGVETFKQMVDAKPAGFPPPFSNWEAFSIDIIRSLDFQYVVLSQALLPQQFRKTCGFWITEQGGQSVPLFPAHVFHRNTIPKNITAWLKKTFKDDTSRFGTKQICIEYLLPLVPEPGDDGREWYVRLNGLLSRITSSFQCSTCGEFCTSYLPRGLQYLPSSLVFKRDDEETIPYFRNILFTYDQVGILQRKLMEVCDEVKSRRQEKSVQPMQRQLFFIQDINRYLPGRNSGFPFLGDRLHTYRKMIDIESRLHSSQKLQGGQIRIIDVLKNGSKCIVMTNQDWKIYCDHKNGGQIFEMDFRPRLFNLCAGFQNRRHSTPQMVVPGETKTCFIDRILLPESDGDSFFCAPEKQRGDFICGAFNYNVKKTSDGVSTILTRNGVVALNEKSIPLNMEKVFTIRDDNSSLSFVYQLSSHSLASFSFMLAVELTFSLPGVPRRCAVFSTGKEKHTLTLDEPLFLDNISKWSIEDQSAGLCLQFITQKPLQVWCKSLAVEDSIDKQEYGGTSFVLASPVSLGEQTTWSLLGKMTGKSIKIKKAGIDEV